MAGASLAPEGEHRDEAAGSARATWALRLIAGAAGAAAAALALGIPTDVVPNQWFTRMTPVRTLDVVLLVATSLALGALAATYVGRTPAGGGGRGAAGGAFAGLAIGCPVCNKAIVALIGTTGAVSWWGPLQPLVGALGLALALAALRTRVRRLRSCAVTG